MSSKKLLDSNNLE